MRQGRLARSPGAAVLGGAGVLFGLGALLRTAVAPSGPDGLRPDPGIVVEDVQTGWAGERAGLQPGDRIERWERLAEAGPGIQSSGAIETPLDWHHVEHEQAPRGRIRLLGHRGSAKLAVELPREEWRARVRPNLPADSVAARELVDAGEVELALWVWMEEASQRLEAGNHEEAERIVETAREAARRGGRTSMLPWIDELWGDALLRNHKPAEAEAPLDRALEELPEESLLRAGVLAKRALAAFRQSGYDEATLHLKEASARFEEHAPGSAPHRAVQILLAKIYRNRADFDAAESLLQSVVRASEERDPGGPLQATALSELGILHSRHGNLDEAERHQRQAAALFESLNVRDTIAGQVAMNLGNVAWYRGDVATAEESYLWANGLFEKTAPRSHFHAWSLQNLGMVALERGLPQTAEDYLRESLSIRESFGSQTTDVGLALENLGVVARRRGDYEEARRFVERALAIHEERIPGSTLVARMHGTLGGIAVDDGDLERAKRHFEASLAIVEKQAPHSVYHAAILFELAELFRTEGRAADAREHHLRVLEMRQRFEPGSWDEALSLHALGLLEREAGDAAEALSWFRRAVDSIETQRTRLGGSINEKALFASTYAALFEDLVASLVEAARPGEAFSVLEAYRARGLAALVGMRRMNLESELPGELRERRAELARAYDAAQSALGKLDARAPTDEVDRHLAELRRLGHERNRLDAEVERASPRLAALESQAGLTPEEARGALDPGTVALSYSVHEDESYLFVLDATTLDVHRLPLGRSELVREIEALRYLLESPGAGAISLSALRERAARLYAVLVAPAEKAIDSAARLLVVPDGPLHGLPFGALVRGSSYLVEQKPIHGVVSLSVYRAIRGGRSPGGETRIVAFGDPEFPGLPPLPGTRAEVQAIASLDVSASTSHLGSEATEERAKALPWGSGLSVLHFATHGVVNDRFPLDSYLALTPSGTENGKLQAWEVFEQMRVDADLVALSGCETALGRAVGGEGLLGLTRAFQFAGARTVLASLWKVGDRATAELMTRFYSELASGASKDAALARAQVAALHRDAAAHPGHWAGFQISGDWR